MSEISIPCGNYKEYTLTYCPEAFLVTGALEPLKPIIWEFKGKSGRYRGEETTDADGTLEILVEEDEGLSRDQFQHFSGAYEFRAYSVDEVGNEVPYVFCGMYDYLVLTFEKVTPMPDPNNATIALDCVEPEPET